MAVFVFNTRMCEFDEVSGPPWGNFQGAAGWNKLTVLTDAGLFQLEHGRWIEDKKVGTSDYFRSLVGAGDVMALMMTSLRLGDYGSWHWKTENPRALWQQLDGAGLRELSSRGWFL